MQKVHRYVIRARDLAPLLRRSYEESTYTLCFTPLFFGLLPAGRMLLEPALIPEFPTHDTY